jgi:hypothetical protein
VTRLLAGLGVKVDVLYIILIVTVVLYGWLSLDVWVYKVTDEEEI